ncbi:MAG: DNA cytosine methyltransferase [Gammaproteobacteria bacterium AqS3]|nr:DNA cytosine methyltransferase [Gammaproteobacteria bacterium AqS3]
MSREPDLHTFSYPVVDVFAGPGGLGEGFAALNRDETHSRAFKNILSIERDKHAHSTLLLRHFFRHFPDGEAPDEYYDYLRGGVCREELFSSYCQEAKAAEASAVRLSLKPDNHKKVSRLIKKRLGKSGSWVLVGGPPCQAYSLVGRSRMRSDPDFEKDERHFLYREYLQIISEHRPPVFVMENVKGLLSARVREKLMIDRILADLSNPVSAFTGKKNGLSYSLYSLSEPDIPSEEADPRSFLVRAEEFGVPQARHRIFIVGVRSDIDIKPKGLKPHDAPTLGETISELPRVRSGLSSRGGSRQADDLVTWKKEIGKLSKMRFKRALRGAEHASELTGSIEMLSASGDFATERFSNRYRRPRPTNHAAISMLGDSRLNVLTGHEARSHMGSDLRRYAYAATFAEVAKRSPKLSDFPEALLPNHRNVDEGCKGEMFSDRFRVQLREKVSTTITSHISKDGHYFIHYDPKQCRSLTVREAARLQTFPDNYKFEGPRTAQYHQVGNAVPVYLARQIAEIIADVLDRAGEIS